MAGESGDAVCCCFSFKSESPQPFDEVQKRLRDDETAWYNSNCCFCLRFLLLLGLFVLMVLIFASTDCDVGPTRHAAGSLLLILCISEQASIISYILKQSTFFIVMNTFNTMLGIALLILLMLAAVNALTWVPLSCNRHSSRSLEVVAAASILAMLGVQVCLALNCKTSALWHRCSVSFRPSEESRPSQQQADVPAELTDKRLLCLLCDMPDGGSISVRQVGLTISLSWFQVLLSLLGWALLLAGCLLLNSNYASPSPLVTAAGAFTVIVALSAIVGGWTAFLGETLIFRTDSRVGRRRLARAALVLSTWLLGVGLVTFCLLLAVAIVSGQERSRGGNSSAASDHAVRQAEGAAYFALVVLAALLGFALRNNALLCRCQNFRCDYVCSCVIEEPRADYDAQSAAPSPHNPSSTVPQQAQAPLSRTSASHSVHPSVTTVQPRPQAALGATSVPQNSRPAPALESVHSQVPAPQSRFVAPTAPPPSPPRLQTPTWRGRPEPPPQPRTPGRPDSPPPSYSQVFSYR